MFSTRTQTEGLSELVTRAKHWNTAEECRELDNVEIRNLHSSPSIINDDISLSMRLALQVARMVENINAYRVLAGKR